MSSPVTVLSYDDLADRLGIERESARRLVVRKRWRRTKGNDGKARVEVPVDEMPDRVTGPVPGERTGQSTGLVPGQDDPGEGEPAAPAVPGLVPVDVTVLSRHIERLEAEVVHWRAKAGDRDLLAGQLEGLKLVLEELRQDRDAWRGQAERLALTMRPAATSSATVPAVASRGPWWRRLVRAA